MRRLLLLTLCLAALLTASALTDAQPPTARQLMDSGRQHFHQRQADQALRCFQQAEANAGADHLLRVRALNNIACVYKYFYHDPLQAYDHLSRAYQLCDSLHYDDFMPVIMVNMGDLINDMDTQSPTADSQHPSPITTRARDIFDQCMKRAADMHNWELLTTIFFNLSNQNYTLPLERYRIILSPEIPDSTPDIQYARLQYRAIQHVQQRRYADARSLFSQQLAVVSARWEPVRDTIATWTSIAYTYRMEGDYAQETACLSRAMQAAAAADAGDLTAHIDNLLTSSRASLLAQRERRQQYALLATALVLLFVVGSAVLLWRKNRQLHSRNQSLYLKNQQLLEAEGEARQLRRTADEKYSRSNLSDPQRTSLNQRIQAVLDTPDTLCEQDFTLAKLAKMVDSNTTYVSQVVNERYATSFSNVLSALRVREACRRMSDESDHYRNVTIEAIAASVGFKSRTAFLNAFKREVGLTPSEYLRMAMAKTR